MYIGIVVVAVAMLAVAATHNEHHRGVDKRDRFVPSDHPTGVTIGRCVLKAHVCLAQHRIHRVFLILLPFLPRVFHLNVSTFLS